MCVVRRLATRRDGARRVVDVNVDDMCLSVGARDLGGRQRADLAVVSGTQDPDIGSDAVAPATTTPAMALR